MSEMSTPAQPGEGSNLLYKLIEWICLAFAVIGGLIFILESVMTVISVLGRAVYNQPIQGDYEIVQMVSAMAIALCLPYCQLRRGHVFVDFFTLWAPERLKKALDSLAALLLALVAFLLCWRVYHGYLDMVDYQETTMVLGLPIWWTYIPMIPAFFMLGVAALVTCLSDLKELFKS
ncbi:TRAP transporter small permease [Marinospirillum alkaliphilum]|uniref:TRAP transporter small permease protein n=1 Tax=Marinospirillum alkaliphilum DSM 21637 TaxID=1122209 RepID=A0A1K1TI05_9GAMM|nr:TRAP transporter small permease [Marinospirillum alkaliphilum]SFX00114.1 TRAP-type C4-dicarboxylate transport system, small permease component [Marinospirillum alkaliphilum DSM 21637]